MDTKYTIFQIHKLTNITSDTIRTVKSITLSKVRGIPDEIMLPIYL